MFTARKAGLFSRHGFKPLQCVRLKHDPPSRPDNYYDPDTLHENPMSRCKRFLRRDVDEIVRKINDPFSEYIDDKIFPKTVDVLIVGGGVIGSSIAYWLQNKCRDGLTIAVIEKDLSVNKTDLSAEEVLL